MTDKELRRLSRSDLLSLLVEQSKEMEDLRQQLQEAQAALEDRTIKIQQAGSIAEAALQLSGIFEAAELACQQYKENVMRLSLQQDDSHLQRIHASNEEADRILANAKKQAELQELRTKKYCEDLLEAARLQAQQYWQSSSGN